MKRPNGHLNNFHKHLDCAFSMQFIWSEFTFYYNCVNYRSSWYKFSITTENINGHHVTNGSDDRCRPKYFQWKKSFLFFGGKKKKMLKMRGGRLLLVMTSDAAVGRLTIGQSWSCRPPSLLDTRVLFSPFTSFGPSWTWMKFNLIPSFFRNFIQKLIQFNLNLNLTKIRKKSFCLKKNYFNF